MGSNATHLILPPPLVRAVAFATYEAETLKGHLDGLLLAALEAGPKHGYAVRESLREPTDGTFDLPTGTIYPALHRLERAGLIAGEWSDPGAGSSPPRLPPDGPRSPCPARGARRVDHVRRCRLRRPRGRAVADDPLITSQLQALASRLPAPLFAEIADGLQETYQALIRQPDPPRAAQAAVEQYGEADTSRALCHQAPWRRHAAGSWSPDRCSAPSGLPR